MNPESGRFFSMDSFEGNNSDPISLHKYIYANANPANSIDPSGNETTVDFAVAEGANEILSGMAALLVHQILQKIAEKLEEDSGIFIYRRGNPNSMKTTALYREDDWKSGLSFSTKRPVKPQYLKFRVINLLIAGFAVFPDGDRTFSNIIAGGELDGWIAGPDHVSVFLPDRARWDAWYNAEKENATQNPFVPNSEETRLLYSQREFLP